MEGPSMSWQAALSLGIPALVAVIGYLTTQRSNLRLNERKDRLERISGQLSDLYGPLFATSTASDAAWRTFRSQYRPGGGYWGGTRPPPTPDEEAAWRLWMTTVFMPLNRQMRDAIVRGAHLLEEENVPDVLLAVCAHVSAYEAVLKRWEEGDFAVHTTPLNFPSDELRDYAGSAVRRLKLEQNRLIRQTTAHSVS